MQSHAQPLTYRKQLSEPLLKQLIADIAEALHDMHSRNMVHLDVKPANMLVKVDGNYCGPLELNGDGVVVRGTEEQACRIQFKLGDLGLACPVYEPRPESGDGRYLCQ